MSNFDTAPGQIPAVFAADVAEGAICCYRGLIGIATAAVTAGGTCYLADGGLAAVPAGTGRGDYLYVAGTPPLAEGALTLTRTASGNTPVARALGSRDAGGRAPVILLRVAAGDAAGAATLAAAVAAAGFTGYAQASASAAANSAADTAVTPLQLNEDVDTGGFHEGVTNPERLTIPTGKGGIYRLTALVSFGSSAAGSYRRIYGYVNGSSVGIIGSAAPRSAENFVHAEWIGALAAGDYIELRVRQDSGSDAPSIYPVTVVLQKLA